jgi:hypothetical protein
MCWLLSPQHQQRSHGYRSCDSVQYLRTLCKLRKNSKVTTSDKAVEAPILRVSDYSDLFTHFRNHWHAQTSVLSLLQSPLAVSWRRILTQKL